MGSGAWERERNCPSSPTSRGGRTAWKGSLQEKVLRGRNAIRLPKMTTKRVLELTWRTCAPIWRRSFSARQVSRKTSGQSTSLTQATADPFSPAIRTLNRPVSSRFWRMSSPNGISEVTTSKVIIPVKCITGCAYTQDRIYNAIAIYGEFYFKPPYVEEVLSIPISKFGIPTSGFDSVTKSSKPETFVI